MFSLDGKVCLVAGGAGYLGTPVCSALAENGATVIVGDIDDERCSEAVAALSNHYGRERIEALHLDVEREESIRRAVDTVIEKRGRLDILVNATMWSTATTVEALRGEDFEHANRVNITANFLLVRKAASVMNEGGSVVLYSSMYGLISPNPGDYPDGINPNPIEYGVGKAAILQMVRYLAAHYGRRNIRVNAIAPGAFPHNSQHVANAELMDRLSKKSMLGRLGRREETAGPVLFLASDASSFVTGQVLSVDGGITAW